MHPTLQVATMGCGLGYLAGYLVHLPDLDHFTETHQIAKTDFFPIKLH